MKKLWISMVGVALLAWGGVVSLRAEAPATASEGERNRKGQVASAAKIMIGRIRGTTLAVRPIRPGNVVLNNFVISPVSWGRPSWQFP